MASEQIDTPKNPCTEEEFEKIVLEQMPQVKYIARRIHEHLPQHVPFEDLVHAGIVGLIDALNKFDSDKNVKFGSYAKFRIRGAILDSLREMDWSPRDLRRKSRRIDTVMQKLQAELGRVVSGPELAKEMGLSLPELQHLLNEIRGLEIGSLSANPTKMDRKRTWPRISLAHPTKTRSLSALPMNAKSGCKKRLRICRNASNRCSCSITSRNSPCAK
jgi:RNA polymerase sigma factor (sigma-70 family)